MWKAFLCPSHDPICHQGTEIIILLCWFLWDDYSWWHLSNFRGIIEWNSLYECRSDVLNRQLLQCFYSQKLSETLQHKSSVYHRHALSSIYFKVERVNLCHVGYLYLFFGPYNVWVPGGSLQSLHFKKQHLWVILKSSRCGSWVLWGGDTLTRFVPLSADA